MEVATASRVTTNRTPILVLLGANALSLIGNTLTAVALPWFVLVTTGSPARAGLVGFAQVLPGFMAGLFGGTVVDRLGYKPVSITADVVSGLAVALVPLLYHTVGLAFWQLLVLVFLGALLDIPGLTARRAVLPELAELGGVRLERVNASFEAVQHMAYLLGPPIAGVLIAWVGASNVLWLDAATFAVSAGAVAVAIPTTPRPQPAQRGRYIDELVAGLRFIRKDRVLFWMMVVLAISNGLGGSLFAVVLPVYAKDTFGSAAELGLLFSALGAGALIGATLYGMLGHRVPRRALWLASFGSMPLVYWVLALRPSLPVLVTIILIGGIATGPTNPLMVTIRHERSPAELRGRVFASYSAVAMAVLPLGMVMTGFLIEGVGFSLTVLALAACQQALAVGIVLLPAFRHLDKPGNPDGGTSDRSAAD